MIDNGALRYVFRLRTPATGRKGAAIVSMWWDKACAVDPLVNAEDTLFGLLPKEANCLTA
jgi:hypothetical protein